MLVFFTKLSSYNMSWQGLLGFILLFNQSIKSEQFTLSNNSTRWPLSSCDLAEPRLVYKNTQFEVAEDIDVISNNSEAWIGYMSVKIPYLFHGCAQVQNTAQKTYSVTRIGFCQTLCGHNSPFGIKAPNGLDILYPASLMGCICFNTSVPEIPLEHFDNDQNNLCEKDSYAILTQISDPSARASISAKHSSTWIQGNSICLKDQVYPASISSILLSGLNAGQQREHWTGILKGATLLNKAELSRFGPTQYSDEEYAFLQGSNKNINFANTGTKQALCCKELKRASCMPTTTKIPSHTHYTEEEATTTKSKEKSEALGTGIGVLVGVLVVVGIGFAVVMLQRRGIISYGAKNKPRDRTDDQHGDMLPNAASNTAGIDKSVANHKYFVLEKQTESVIEQINHFNRSEDLEKDIIDENIYHSIDEPAAELRVNVKVDCGDYDYTTDGAATSRGITHENVYNKLKIGRQDNYEYVQGSFQIKGITTHNDYDTTATPKAIHPHGNDDYDHVGGMGNAPAFSPSDDDNSSAVNIAANARGSAAGIEKPDDSHGQNRFVKV
ncbi:uncharacterized protein LOC127859657 [Dreissena polymorpha]|uniref:uncharacterized protein LOC127859657 n=1 Tax=Dreissena polymorpha TaxID=45954 RepID=UPI002264E55E|nr:uncharacterized protein LOC127859657 [Dreissena polymorpha]